MNLHRTSAKPEWATVAAADRTGVQKLAARTFGIVTPPNIITVIGLGVVVYGLVEITRGHIWTGLVLVIAGRLLDIVDGVVAEKTHTKSPLGELFDATADKLGTLLTIIVLVLAGIVPWLAATALIMPQLLISLVVLYKKRAGIKIHPTRQGKISMATIWVSIGGLLLAQPLHSQPVVIGAYVALAISVSLGLYALWQYATGRD